MEPRRHKNANKKLRDPNGEIRIIATEDLSRPKGRNEKDKIKLQNAKLRKPGKPG